MPWYREVSRREWKTFLTTYAAWTLDAFDFTIITFVLTDIRRSFEVNLALAGALATVTLLFRMVGGIGAGTLADRYGRKGPILFSIAWFTGFALLSGLSTSYVMLFACRGLFGIGMGGMWAAGMPLALEQWPAKHRGIASGILQGGYSTGFLLSSLVYQLGYPLVDHNPEFAWRLMLWAGVLPAIVIFYLMTKVSESPLWLEQQRQRGGKPVPLSLKRLFDRDLRWVTIHTSILMGAFVWMYQSTTIWYPTLLANLKQQPLAFLLLLNAGGMLGSIAFGALSEKWGGRRGAATVGMIAGVLSAPVYLFSTTTGGLLLGAWLIGFCASGAWGIVPGYLAERFPTEVRGVGTGFTYHVGVGIGAFAPYLIGAMTDAGTQLQTAMFWCVIAGGIGVITFLWLGPETRGRELA
ncbi:MAG TPA: MFS transporter [Vicinamibacterales bacterium]|nr:MFS transporter [Vicinamibacterales bacterium]